jgi:hypothetical protein
MQVGPGKWKLRYRVDGKRVTETVKADSKTKALEELTARKNAANKGTFVAPDKITLAEWSKEWLSPQAGRAGPLGEEGRDRRRGQRLQRLADLRNRCGPRVYRPAAGRSSRAAMGGH